MVSMPKLNYIWVNSIHIFWCHTMVPTVLVVVSPVVILIDKSDDLVDAMFDDAWAVTRQFYHY